MKSTPIFALALLSLTAFLAAAPAYATPDCTATGSIGSNNYTVTLSPCSSSGVALNTGVSAKGTTNDGTVTNVEFDFYNPSSVLTYSPVVSGSGTFTSASETLNAPGTWQVVAIFYAGSAIVTSVVFDINVQILVLNALPFGAVAAAGIALVGFAVYRRYNRPNPKATITAGLSQ